MAQFSAAQNASALYKKADSLYAVKDFKNSATAYAAGIKMQGTDADVGMYWNAASAWSLANFPDSAFYLLSMIAKSNKVSQGDAKAIQGDKDFTALHTDKRWKPSMDKIMTRATTNYTLEELIYGRKDGIALTMLHINPKSKPNGKAIIRVVAGSWFSSYQQAERNIRSSSMYLDRGYAVFLVVLGSQPRFAIPDEIADAKRAVRYVRYNANKFRIDPNHIGIEGSSAGGHISLVLATADEKIDATAEDPADRVSSRVQAAAVLYPPTDFLNWGNTGYSVINTRDLQKQFAVYGAFDFRTWNNVTRTYDPVADTSARNIIGKEISPVYAVSPDDPPIFIIHGDADQTVPLQQSQTFIAKLKEAGVPNNFIIKKGVGHNYEAMEPEVNKFVEWFDRYLK